ncbi:MAG: hypothetical protein FJ319_01010 [SAR202 cluster bacterium]|nr:hypothetical protein [SAR202 cluster bacterium]
MRLLITGAEYTGTTTLSWAIVEWMRENMGVANLWTHDHFKWPHLSHPRARSAAHQDEMYADWLAGKAEDPTRLGLTLEEQKKIMALSPRLREMFQRYLVSYHVMPAFFQEPDYIVIGMHIEEAVYAPMYMGYGRNGEYGDRAEMAMDVEQALFKYAPDLVMVMLNASPEVVSSRMKATPHTNSIVPERDVPTVLRRFEEVYAASSIHRKFKIDTSKATVQESLAEFLQKMEPLWSDTDRLRIMSHKQLRRFGHKV